MGMSSSQARKILESIKIGDTIEFVQPAPPGERMFVVQEIKRSISYVESVRGQNKRGGIGTEVLSEMGLTSCLKLKINGKSVYP
jgi:hypothetical protein